MRSRILVFGAAAAILAAGISLQPKTVHITGDGIVPVKIEATPKKESFPAGTATTGSFSNSTATTSGTTTFFVDTWAPAGTPSPWTSVQNSASVTCHSERCDWGN